MCFKCGDAPAEDQDKGVLCHVCLSKINDRMSNYWADSANSDAASVAEAGAAPAADEAVTI
ncbi:hypothetical protein DL991_10635 [Amycolatopsis sp. WAC 01375]|nr:hypothetical protein DL991_10635 [Amycolatopsis sp. WAC 01375]